MAGNLTQLGIANETVYGTAVAPAKWFEILKEDIKGNYTRVQGEGLNSKLYDKFDRFVITNKGAAGSMDLEVLTKGFQDLLTYLNGKTITSGPTETSVYTHLSTPFAFWNKSFTLQVGRSQEDSTIQPWTYEGGKVNGYTLSNSAEKLLIASLDMDFELESNPSSPAGAYVLGTPSLPTGAEVLSWQGATITVGGTQYDLSDISFKVDNALNTDRWMLHKGQTKRQPVEDGKRKVTWDFTVPYTDRVLWQKVSSATIAGSYATIVAKWEGLTLLGTTIYPNLTVTITNARFDTGGPNVDGPGMLDAKFSGVGLSDATNEGISLQYQSADTTALASG